jgi:hypothetical protein
MPASSAAVTPGTKCPKVGTKQTYKGKIYTCIKLGSRLYWNNGKEVNSPKGKATSSAAPKPSDAPSVDKCENVTSREWKLIAKNPNGSIGRNIWIYGNIRYFVAPGTSLFIADISGVNLFDGKYWFGGSETAMKGNSRALSNIVADDVFKACVRVVGAASYEHQTKGVVWLPTLLIRTIEYIGNTGP